MTASAREVELGEDVPIGVLEVDLAQSIDDVTGHVDGEPWVAAIVVVRLHSVPLGMLVVRLEGREGPFPGASVASAIERAFGDEVAAHLACDRDAVGEPEVPACVAPRARLLADPPRVSVIIPTRDRAATLGRCIDSILACDYDPQRREIVIVDNVPRDDSTRRVVEGYAAAGHPVRYAREDRPGSASARNRGLTVVENDLVIFTDDDALADRWWLAEVATTFMAHPDAGAVTGMLLPTTLETRAQLWFEQYGGFSRGFEERVFTVDRASDPGNPLYPYAAGIFGTGNNMAFRRSVLDGIGAFDPALGNGTPALGGVDSEVLQRTVLCGHKLVYTPRAIVWHSHRREYEQLRRQIYSYGAGLTAYLAKTVIRNPHLIGDFLSRVPAGARFALSPTSEKNTRKTHSYPSGLTRAERVGMLYGLLAYPRSRLRMGPHRTPRAIRPR